jgi:heat shock protein HslJ
MRFSNQRFLIAVGCGVAMTVPLATTIAAPAASAAGGCNTKLAEVKGQPVEISCGPASAKLHFKGKTYSFKAGTCRSSNSGGQKGGTLTLGKNVDVTRNLGLVGMSIAFTGNIMGSAVVTANQGKVYINDGAATATPKFGSAGTIKGTNGGIPYTVSWNCGGAPVKG